MRESIPSLGGCAPAHPRRLGALYVLRAGAAVRAGVPA